jgi:hypothetical protein
MRSSKEKEIQTEEKAFEALELSHLPASDSQFTDVGFKDRRAQKRKGDKGGQS